MTPLVTFNYHFLAGDAGQMGPSGPPGEAGGSGQEGPIGLPGRDGKQGFQGSPGLPGKRLMYTCTCVCGTYNVSSLHGLFLLDIENNSNT